MLTSKHQTVNERRASAASWRTFSKLRRAPRSNKKRRLSLARRPFAKRVSFIGHSDRDTRELSSIARKLRVSRSVYPLWSRTFSSWHFWQSPERRYEAHSPTKHATAYASTARASPATHPVCQARTRPCPSDVLIHRSGNSGSTSAGQKPPTKLFPRR